MTDSVIVIGAGLAGLTAGCYARLNGYDTHIFEHANKPGGVAACWKRGEYTIDGGIHFLMGHKPEHPFWTLYEEVGADRAAPFVDLTNYSRVIDEPSGRSVDLVADLPQLAERLKSLSAADFAIVNDLIAAADAFRTVDMARMGLEKPPELMTWLDQARQLWAMRGILRYFRGKYARPMQDYTAGVHDPLLRKILTHLFLPESPVWFVLFVLALLGNGDAGLITRGSGEFAAAVERRFVELGGQATYHATVEQILVENGRAVGVRLADGTLHRAGAVISAADGHSTVYDMLGGRYTDADISKRYETWNLFKPWITLSFGVAQTFSDQPCFTMVYLADPIMVGADKIDFMLVRIFNYTDRLAPEGKTVVQVSLDTEWDYWNDLRRDRPGYDAEKERVAAEVLARLEPHYPDLSSRVEMTDVATPYTTWRYTRNWRGSYEGWLPAADVILMPIPRTLPGLDRLWLAGQWVLPGGGVAPSMYSGKHAVQLLCRAHGKRFASRA